MKPNIIFIFADDWGWGDLSCHGHPELKTPVLDRLASEGTDFHEFTVNGPVCSPSRAAVLTGHFPARHRIHRHFASHEHNQRCGMPDWLDPKVTLLPRLLQQAGYKTAHYGKWHLTNRHIRNAPVPARYGYDDTRVFNGGGPQIKGGPKEHPSALLTTESVDCTVRFLRKHRNDPFFINLWIHETHAPVDPTDEMRKPYQDLPEPKQSYYSVVTAADEQIGRVLGTLKELDLEDNTLVIFSSDNGPEQRSKHCPYSIGSTGGLRGRKRSLYEGGVRLPYIVRWPGRVPAGKTDKTTVITGVDLLPTFCAAAGVELPAGYEPDGQNMLPALLGKQVKRKKPIFWEWRGPKFGANWPRLGIRDGDWKLLMTYDRKRLELYHVPTDRAEKKDRADEEPEIVRKLMARVEAWKKTLPD